MKRHSTDMISLFFGLVFAAVATSWIFGTTTDFTQTAGWLLIGMLLVLAIVGLVSAARQPARVAPAEPAQAVPAEPATEAFGEADPDSTVRTAEPEHDTAILPGLGDPERDGPR